MIRVVKPTTVPKKLKKAGVDENKVNCAAFDADKAAFLKSFSVKTKIYGGKSIKKSLKKAQHNKCCFCEKDQVDEYGAVEHYRPKKGFKLNRKQKKMNKPGYYWLSYSWDNLFFVCGKCNTTYKGTIFPLEKESDRAKSHHADIALESPLLLDPAGSKDPRDHIYFINQFPMYRSVFGQNTIEICGLDRDDLNTKRAKLINDIEARLLILAAAGGYTAAQLKKASDFIADCQKPSAEFSAAAIDFIANYHLTAKIP